jgi:hypothetical protein
MASCRLNHCAGVYNSAIWNWTLRELISEQRWCTATIIAIPCDQPREGRSVREWKCGGRGVAVLLGRLQLPSHGCLEAGDSVGAQDMARGRCAAAEVCQQGPIARASLPRCADPFAGDVEWRGDLRLCCSTRFQIPFTVTPSSPKLLYPLRRPTRSVGLIKFWLSGACLSRASRPSSCESHCRES